MRWRCGWAWNAGAVTFDLGDMTLTLCVSDGDASNPCRALVDLVSFLVARWYVFNQAHCYQIPEVQRDTDVCYRVPSRLQLRVNDGHRASNQSDLW